MLDHLSMIEGGWKRWLLWAASALPLVLWSCHRALTSDGVYHDDDMMHYLMARWSWSDPVYLLHDWGRPGFTAPYALVAWIGDYAQGMMASRFLTIAFAGTSAVFASAIAHELGARRAWVAGVLLMLMPLYFRLSFATLTETVCGFYLITGTWLLAKGRFNWAAVFLAIAPLTRHESVVFLVPVAIYFVARRAWLAVVLLAWAEALWNVLGAKWYWMLPIQRYFQGKPIEHYGHGGALHYVLMWGSVTTPVLVGLSLAGAGLVVAIVVKRWIGERSGEQAEGSPVHSGPSVRRWWAKLASTPPSEAAGAFVVIGALGMIALQTVLFYRNVFASGGYPRFLVPAGPWLAVLAAVAVDRLIGAVIPSDAHPRGERGPAIRWAGALMAVGIGGIWLATKSDTPDESGLIRSLYSGTPGFYVEHYTLPLVIGCVILAALPRRYTAAVLLALCAWCVGNVWRADNKELVINAREWLIKQGVDAAYEAAKKRGIESPEIRGQSPWVSYYTQRRGSTTELLPADRWMKSKDGDALYLIVDNDFTRGPDRDKLDAIPQNVIFDDALNKHLYNGEPYKDWYQIEVLERISSSESAAPTR
jgi:hypothetical protein